MNYFRLSLLTLYFFLSFNKIASAGFQHNNSEIYVYEYYNEIIKSYSIYFLYDSQLLYPPYREDIRSELFGRKVRLKEINFENYNIRHLYIRVANTVFKQEDLNYFLDSILTKNLMVDSIRSLEYKVVGNINQSECDINDSLLDSLIISPKLIEPFINLKGISIISNILFTLIPDSDSFKLNNLEDLNLNYYGQNHIPSYLISDSLKDIRLTAKCDEDTFYFPTLSNILNFDSVTKVHTKFCNLTFNYYCDNINYVHFKFNNSLINNFNIRMEDADNCSHDSNFGLAISINMNNSEILGFSSRDLINSLTMIGQNGYIENFRIFTTKDSLKSILNSQIKSVCIKHLNVSYIGRNKFYIKFGLFKYVSSYFGIDSRGNFGGKSPEVIRVFSPYFSIHSEKKRLKDVYNNCSSIKY
jgi:hypothetical protein